MVDKRPTASEITTGQNVCATSQSPFSVGANMSLRVVHVTPYYWPAIEWGGPVQSVRTLAEAQARLGASVEVFTTTSRARGDLPRLEARSANVGGVVVRYYHARGSRRYGVSPSMFLALWGAIGGADVVHAHGLWVPATAVAVRLARMRRRPVVVSPRGTLDAFALAQRATKKRVYLALVERATLNAASLIHYTTEGERDGVPSSMRSLPSMVLYNAVDLRPLQEVRMARASSGALRILMVGRIHRIKGFDLFLPALAKAQQAGIRCHLRIAGPNEDGYRTQIESLIAGLGLSGNVTILGPIDRGQLVAELEACDVVAQPSYTENFGMTCAEAMAAARPVLVSERVNLAPLVSAAGAGVVVPLDVDGICAGLVALARGVYDLPQMGARGRVAALHEFEPESVAKRMLGEYRKLTEIPV